MDIRFFTLLYITEHSESTHFSFVKDYKGEERLLVYLKNCHVLNRSININLHRGGVTVLTNNKAYIEMLQKKYGLSFDIEQIKFNLSVPQDINFHSAHFKIETYKYFGTLTDTYSILLDNDMVCTKALPSYMNELVEKGIALHYAYPTTNVHNHDVAIMKSLEPEIVTGEWSGGEFIGGTSRFFDALYKEILSFIDKYFDNRKQMFHQGDEMLTSIAIEYLKLHDKWNIVNSGTIGLSYRYIAIQENRPIESYNSCFYHLICDKLFLASLADSPFESSEEFFKRYNKYYKRAIRMKKTYHYLRSLLKHKK